MESTVICHPAQHRLTLVREHYRDICGGDDIAAALLNAMERWYLFKLKNREQARSKNKVAQTAQEQIYPEDESLWVRMTGQDWVREVMGMASEKTIRAKLDLLEELGFCRRRSNPKWGFDRTWQWMFLRSNVQKAVDEWDGRRHTPDYDPSPDDDPDLPNGPWKETSEESDSIHKVELPHRREMAKNASQKQTANLPLGGKRSTVSKPSNYRSNNTEILYRDQYTEEETRARAQSDSGSIKGTLPPATPNASSKNSVAEISDQSVALPVRNPVSNPSESEDTFCCAYWEYWDDQQQTQPKTRHLPTEHEQTKQAHMTEQEKDDPAAPLTAFSQQGSSQSTGGQAYQATDKKDIPHASEKYHESKEVKEVNARLQQLTNTRWLTSQGSAPAWIDEMGSRGVDRHRIAHEVSLSRLEGFWDEAREEVATANRENRNTPKPITLLIRKLEAHLCMLDELHRAMQLAQEVETEPASLASENEKTPQVPTDLQVGDIVLYEGEEAEVLIATQLGIELLLPDFRYVTVSRSLKLEIIDRHPPMREEISSEKIAELQRIAFNKQPEPTTLETASTIEAAGD